MSIHVKIHPDTKAKAQEVAHALGFSLSALVNAFLKHLVRTKKVTFSLDEEPSKYLLKAMKRSEEQLRKRETSPLFDTAEDAIKWLHEQSA